jgi:hypothetical protein
MPRQKMTIEKRAKIFLPFDALEGFRDLLKSKAQDKKKEDVRILSEEDLKDINNVLSSLKKGMLIRVVFYNTKEKCYIEKTGVFTKMNINDRFIMVIKDKIIIDDISEIEILDDELNI